MPTIITIAAGVAFEILKHKTNVESIKKMLSIFSTLIWIFLGIVLLTTGGLARIFIG